jgi:hypothetical protein
MMMRVALIGKEGRRVARTVTFFVHQSGSFLLTCGATLAISKILACFRETVVCVSDFLDICHESCVMLISKIRHRRATFV